MCEHPQHQQRSGMQRSQLPSLDLPHDPHVVEHLLHHHNRRDTLQEIDALHGPSMMLRGLGTGRDILPAIQADHRESSSE